MAADWRTTEHTMKAAISALTAIALGLLTGCGKADAPIDAHAEASASSEPALPIGEPSAAVSAEASTAAAPVLKAASYPPSDDCAGQPGWPDFRATLEAAVARRDAAALAGLTDPDVQLDYGGGHGLAEMKRRLDDKDYKLWEQIAALLPAWLRFQGRSGLLAMGVLERARQRRSLFSDAGAGAGCSGLCQGKVQPPMSSGG